MFDTIRKLIGIQVPDGSDDFKNTFGKSYGTDHLLKMGWLSYFGSTFPPGSNWVPIEGTIGYDLIEMSWYVGATMMFDNIRDASRSGDNARIGRSLLERNVDRLWLEYNGAEDREAMHFNERKAAFAAGCWLVNTAMVSMAMETSDQNKFQKNWAAVSNELTEYAAKRERARA